MQLRILEKATANICSQPTCPPEPENKVEATLKQRNILHCDVHVTRYLSLGELALMARGGNAEERYFDEMGGLADH